ncbi:MAG: DNA methyltransferase [Pseudomonadota bacterium]
MPLSWNEIKDRALRFSKEWADEVSEDAEAKSFWDGFFDVFGVSRRRVASFERRVKKVDGKDGYIDLLWKGVLLVEHKSKGKDLDRAHQQARDYFHGLTDVELPRYILVSDFDRCRLYDLDNDKIHEFRLKDLHKQVKLFGFLAGYKTHTYKEEDPVNIAAAERMGALHDALKDGGYEGHPLEVLLVRLLFCLFADDTGIFQPRQFHELILNRTSADGADLGARLTDLFQVLNTPGEKRQKALDEQLAEFPYVNGKLFAETLPLAAFDSAMRKALIEAADLDWSRISPAIFGSLFQSIMDKKARRNLGAHYTSEKNILKLIGPLCMDDLKAEFERIKGTPAKLKSFHVKLANLRFLDPACGCGNFLVIAYRELRLLELEVLKAQFAKQDALFSGVAEHVNVDVDQFYGIEIEEFPAQIAQVAMWLMDHQMNLMVSEHFGEYFVRLPLKKSATIVHGNALRVDWAEVCPKERLSYVLGNPPFGGKQYQSEQQKADMAQVFNKVKGYGVLDFVSAWYFKAAALIADSSIRCAFVSTNSICQGEQVGILWSELFRLGVKIHFAHRTFRWNSEGRGSAAVHCVIIGFWPEDGGPHRLFDYDDSAGEPHEISASNINPYLVDATDIVLQNRRTPVCAVSAMAFGSMPNDGGNLLLDDTDKSSLLASEPEASTYIRRFMGSEEFINNVPRWCLWLLNVSPDKLAKLPQVSSRVAAVRFTRLNSDRDATRKLAAIPSLFGEIRQPNSNYLLVPSVSSERRTYIPVGFNSPSVIASNLVNIVPDASCYEFGVITSSMHMAWVRYVCGRLKSDFRYSVGIVYNNFPWPDSPTDKQKQTVERAAQQVLDARAKFPNATLADLYDPVTMPPELAKAHQQLDKAVDAAYGKTTFKSDAERVAFLFSLYQKYTSLLPADKPKKAGRKQASE